MTVFNSQITFAVAAAPTVVTATADLVLLPENNGLNAARELHYPGDLLPPLIYPEPPDSWENFDSGPLTARPTLKQDQTLEGALLTQWPGYQQDLNVVEVWKGSDTKVRMSAYFLRRLWEYYANPPAEGYITWIPKDRINQAYNIRIDSLVVAAASKQVSTVARQDIIAFLGVALRHGYIVGEVIFSFYIIGEAD